MIVVYWVEPRNQQEHRKIHQVNLYFAYKCMEQKKLTTGQGPREAVNVVRLVRGDAEVADEAGQAVCTPPEGVCV